MGKYIHKGPRQDGPGDYLGTFVSGGEEFGYTITAESREEAERICAERGLKLASMITPCKAMSCPHCGRTILHFKA